MIRLLFDFPQTLGGPPVRREFRDPVEVVRADTVAEVLPALDVVRRRVEEGLWAAGYLAYEAAPAFDPAYRVRSGPTEGECLLWFGIFDGPSGAPGAAPGADSPALFGPWTMELDEEAFARRIERIHDAIADGETYQVNLTARMRARIEAPTPDGRSLASLYPRLRAAQGPGYHALLELDDRTILSASPELFFQLRGREVTTRPMKGTSSRGRWLLEDMERAGALQTSEKERAENRMIVDLIRNDLGKICRIGTVEVTGAFEVERYRTVLQMTSTVRGRIAEDASFVEVLSALFPCGSVTGAPKIHTMGIISELEASPRGVYCGALGFVEGGSGDATFNVPIRTLWQGLGSAHAFYGVGSGVTWGSTVRGEYEELGAKARILEERWPSFDLLESLRLEDGRYLRLDRHLSRMAASARYFERPYPDETIRSVLAETANAHPEGAWKVRLLVDSDGRPRVTTEELERALEVTGSSPGASPPLSVRVARRPVDSGDRFLFHKTTHRDVYESRLRDHPDAVDVLLVNEDGLVTEFTRGNFVARIDGRHLTPSRGSGLLAGCFRDQLLDEGVLEEADLTPDDVEGAEAVWLINSVREWVPVVFARPREPRAGRPPASPGRPTASTTRARTRE